MFPGHMLSIHGTVGSWSISFTLIYMCVWSVVRTVPLPCTNTSILVYLGVLQLSRVESVCV